MFAFVELIVALLILKHRDWNTIILFASIIVLLNLRQKFCRTLNTFIAFFLTYYFTINFCVNFFDLIWNFAYKGLSYRRDSDFTSSFSYKTH